ncbi:hypothetical protein J4Q44_G00031830 [Coregonus suidteri]|uniref:Uncharacterized protein n=1 Tax=Coregonus suidteri TaxID=861788 RepID=A0AAN8MB58_9TELE
MSMMVLLLQNSKSCGDYSSSSLWTDRQCMINNSARRSAGSDVLSLSHFGGTDRKSNMSLPEVVTLDGEDDGGFGGQNNVEAGVPSSDVELTLDLVPVRMVFTEAGHLTSTTAVVHTRPSCEAPMIPDPVT